jgi:tetratricopeptide (TPR) repeat protein
MRRLLVTLVSSVALTLVAPPRGSAQEDAHAACAAAGWVPREILGRPVPLRAGVGNAHEVVTTSSKDAQAFYDQGLNYLHGYVWIEAARSFTQALRLDPDLAMAHVGLSRVYSGLDAPDDAGAALAKAQALAPKASARERRRIEIRARQLEALADLADAARHAAYKKAIDDALAADIDDVELWLLRGNAEEATAAGRGQRGGAASTAFYLAALQRVSDHGAAHHYLTHSYETIGQIPRALEHGEVYARIAPGIPHAHHMWGHDLRRVGRIDDAIAAFKKTDALEKAYYDAEKIDAGYDWHHVHNLDLLAGSYQHKGQMRLAEATLREALAQAAVTDRLAFDQKGLAMFLVDRGRFEEGLAAARALGESKWSVARTVGRAFAGEALLGLKRRAEAEQELAAATAALEDVPAAVAGISVSRGQVKPYVDMLQAKLMLTTDAATEGRVILKEVQRVLRATPGPDAWMSALFRLEAIARAAREAGDWELADYTARQMLEHDAAYGGSHLAAALVARHRGDAATADASLATAGRCWRDADADLPELKLTRSAAVSR